MISYVWTAINEGKIIGTGTRTFTKREFYDKYRMNIDKTINEWNRIGLLQFKMKNDKSNIL